jgi:CubicO group peptidase (beta-lactamase class C family)
VGFVVDKVALRQVFSEYLGSPANLHSTNISSPTAQIKKKNKYIYIYIVANVKYNKDRFIQGYSYAGSYRGGASRAIWSMLLD